jgi:hypothetical protein
MSEKLGREHTEFVEFTPSHPSLSFPPSLLHFMSFRYSPRCRIAAFGITRLLVRSASCSDSRRSADRLRAPLRTAELPLRPGRVFQHDRQVERQQWVVVRARQRCAIYALGIRELAGSCNKRPRLIAAPVCPGSSSSARSVGLTGLRDVLPSPNPTRG